MSKKEKERLKKFFLYLGVILVTIATIALYTPIFVGPAKEKKSSSKEYQKNLTPLDNPSNNSTSSKEK